MTVYLTACGRLLPYLSRCPYIYLPYCLCRPTPYRYRCPFLLSIRPSIYGPFSLKLFCSCIAGWYNSLGKISNSVLHLSRSSSVFIHDTVPFPKAVFARSSQPRQGSLSLLLRNSHKCSTQDSHTQCVTKVVNVFEESSVDLNLQPPVD